MAKKILRFQIALFSLVTFLAFIATTYRDSFPDNYFSITSHPGFSWGLLNDLSYYLTSTLAFVEYLTGPWPFIPFALFVLLFFLCYNKRDFWPDIFVLVWFLGMSLTLSIIFYPSLVGRGLHFLIRDNVPLAQLAAWATFFILLFFISTSPRGLLRGLHLFAHAIGRMGKRREKAVVEVSPDRQRQEDVIEVVKTVEATAEATVEATVETIRPEPKYYDLVVLPRRAPPICGENPDKNYFEKIVKRLEEKIWEFKIEGRIVNVLKGPVVDTFELELGSGVKVSRLISISEDLSLALYGTSLRMVYPMKGRSTVGIELPRSPRELIYLEDVLGTDEFKHSHHHLPLAMGKNTFGEVLIVDLAAMPHMLVAGATGAGKSVFLNTLLISLLAQKSPTQMKLILIDPKQLELSLYARLPHLVMPVCTEAESVAQALRWACEEMERRFSILRKCGVRNIEDFNKKKLKRPALPYLVIVIDEFADLVLSRREKNIEGHICRLTAKARAAGIHLIVATQRPSVDVVTGLIKSNFPTRVSFRVTTSVDSRTILNTQGAERLLGKGDMLFKHGVETLRLHSAFVDEEEIGGLTDRLSKIPQNFDPKAMDFLKSSPNRDLQM